MKRVIIVGMGFGGVRAARKLANKDVEVLLIDQHNYHLFQPLLYQVATAGLDQDSVAYPIRSAIRKWRNTRFLMAKVTGIDLEARQVYADGEAISYDYLILAVGGVTNYFGMESVAKYGFMLKTLDDSVTLRNHILNCFERATREEDPDLCQGLLTFVVVGAGPTGVEFSGALAELIRYNLLDDYPEVPREAVHVALVEALGNVLPVIDPSQQEYTKRRLEQLGVDVYLNSLVTEVFPDSITLKDGTSIRTNTLVWTAGVQAAPLARSLPEELRGPGGRTRVEPDLSLPGHPEVFAIGDQAYFEEDGKPLPMLSPVAIQQGTHAARMVLLRERGDATEPFEYHDKGTMAIIGRYHAVASAFGIKMKGFIAWLAWLALHLYYLVGFRNQMVALLNWVYAYLFVDPKIRLITTTPRRADEVGQQDHLPPARA